MPFDTDLVHRSTSDELEELAAAFALEALTPDERRDYGLHLMHCGLCVELTSEFVSVANVLPEVLEPQSVSVGLKERILSQARTGTQASESEQATGQDKRQPRRAWPDWLTPRPMWVPAILVLLVVALFAWNVSIQAQLRQEAESQVTQEALIKAIGAGASIVRLSGTDASPSSVASLVHTPGAKDAFLMVLDLPQLPTGQEYQVWDIRGDQAFGAGTFDRLGNSLQLVTLNADFVNAEAIGVSIEPRGGSPSPTGAIVLLGTP